jgi:hypothetical protein
MAAVRAVLLGALLACCVSVPAESRVLLVVVDGLDAREVTADVMPELTRAWGESPWCPNARVLAAMPTRTNSNHATLITGVQPEAHGITGNAFWDRKLGRHRKLGTASDLQTETIFTTAHRAGRGLRTAAAVGKPKLGVMFAADGDRQYAPDELWDARAASDASRDDVTGYAYDATTLAAARALVEHAGADFVLVNLSDVDRVSHGTGPGSPQAIETRRRTDAALAAFVRWLKGRSDWPSTTVVITADHGFDAITNAPLRFADVLAARGIANLVAVGDAGIGHVYVREPQSPRRTAALLASARRAALEQPGIADAVYLRPNKLDGRAAHTVEARYPDWHVTHERSGDLILVARSGFQLVDGSTEEAKLIGNHGGPGERQVPVVVITGTRGAGPARCDDLHAADLGRTVQACLGLPEVRRLDGRPIASADRGRVLAGICPAPAATPVVTVP